MTKIHLGMNCNFAVNRFTEPEVWTEIVGKDLGLRYVQFVSDLIEPSLPSSIQEKICKNTVEACKKYGIDVYATFGGHLAHRHLLGHPNDDIAREGERWMRSLIDQASMLGARGTGTCFAIMTARDSVDHGRREYILGRAIEAYRRLSIHAKKRNLEYLMFEPTSVPRESACTIEETKNILKECVNMEVPMRLCLDVGHGFVNSGNPGDGDPYRWIREFGSRTAVIHIQQTDKQASQHWPFTGVYNRKGAIRGEKVIEAIEKSGANEVLCAFETNHKAFYPMEDRVIDDLRESVAYWRRYIQE